ncbi:hypothetical protein KDD93_03590 [Campylobacter sp. faydin G-24]|uniref:Uncharacterized protein n=1 Tax=Campylobacter anatolicus TaxID=2829105 RepID=A0ABS5HHA6_9BACT|nr:hypothetical protein [Campylobacter anatolicus]MBR8463656.1 hypothetical protein [Campylobacter anatolicus]
MLVELEKELITAIKEVCKNTKPYLGEFEDKNEMELLIKGGENFVFIEFVGEKYEDYVNKVGTYNVHILSATSSKQEAYRQENKYNCLDMCEQIDKKLKNVVLNNEFGIELGTLKVLHNSITDYGYIYVLSREIQTNFREKDEWMGGE